jgi:hypothetical protein
LRPKRGLRTARIALAIAVLLPATAIWAATAYAADPGGPTGNEAVATTANASSVDQPQNDPGKTASTGTSQNVSQSAVASSSAHGSGSSATATASSTSSVSQSTTVTGGGPSQQQPEQSTHVVQSATATATSSGASNGGSKSGDAVAVARNVSDSPSSEQPAHVVQTATAAAQSGPSADGKSGDSVAVAMNVSEIEPSNEQSVNVVQTATASSPAGGDGSPAVAMNVSKIGHDGPRDSSGSSSGADGVADVCNAPESDSTCVQRNAANVEQTAEAKGAGSLALNRSDIEHSDQIEGRDAGVGSTGTDGGSSNSAAGVCNAGGPAVNCTQEHVVDVSQTAVADGVGAAAVNDGDVSTVNQIAGRDAGVDSSQGDSADTNSAAGVCNSGGPTVNCTQKSTLTLTQTSVAEGDGAAAMSEADVLSVNQITGRDAGVGSTGGSNQSSNGAAGVCAEDASVANCSAAGVCNAGGPTVNCTQTNTVAVEQKTTAAGDGAAANSELDFSALNQITGRDAGAGAAGAANQNVSSAAGVCNAGGPTIANCTQENTLSVEVTTAADGDEAAVAGEVEVAAVNQIAGRDAGAGPGSAGGDGAATASDTKVAAVNQITGRDAGAGLGGADNQSTNSAAGVCNAGGETVNCTQTNTVTVGGAVGADVAAVNEITGRDAGAGSSGAANQGANSAAGVCNAGGPTVNCTQDNTVTLDQAAGADVAALNQIAGRDAGAGSTGGNNEGSSSAAGVCNAGGETVNCTQGNTVTGAATGTEAAAVNQIAGRDAVAGAAAPGTQGGDSSADICNSDGETCAQDNTVSFQSGARASAIKQIAGRNDYLGFLFGIGPRLS